MTSHNEKTYTTMFRRKNAVEINRELCKIAKVIGRDDMNSGLQVLKMGALVSGIVCLSLGIFIGRRTR